MYFIKIYKSVDFPKINVFIHIYMCNLLLIFGLFLLMRNVSLHAGRERAYISDAFLPSFDCSVSKWEKNKILINSKIWTSTSLSFFDFFDVHDPFLGCKLLQPENNPAANQWACPGKTSRKTPPSSASRGIWTFCLKKKKLSQWSFDYEV